MQRSDGSERHCATPGSGIVARVLRPVSRQTVPSLQRVRLCDKTGRDHLDSDV